MRTVEDIQREAAEFRKKELHDEGVKFLGDLAGLLVLTCITILVLAVIGGLAFRLFLWVAGIG